MADHLMMNSHWWLYGKSEQRSDTPSTGIPRWPSPACTSRRRRRPQPHRSAPRTSLAPWTQVCLQSEDSWFIQSMKADSFHSWEYQQLSPMRTLYSSSGFGRNLFQLSNFTAVNARDGKTAATQQQQQQALRSGTLGNVLGPSVQVGHCLNPTQPE